MGWWGVSYTQRPRSANLVLQNSLIEAILVVDSHCQRSVRALQNCNSTYHILVSYIHWQWFITIYVVVLMVSMPSPAWTTSCSTLAGSFCMGALTSWMRVPFDYLIQQWLQIFACIRCKGWSLGSCSNPISEEVGIFQQSGAQRDSSTTWGLNHGRFPQGCLLNLYICTAYIYLWSRVPVNPLPR